MKRALALLLFLMAGLAAVVLARALGGPAAAPAALAPAPLAFDRDAAVERFAGAVRIPTISNGEDSGIARDDAAFEAFHRYLERSYPRVHASLRREKIAGLSLLYTWEGSDPSLDPVVLMGHIDVVPVDPESQGRWTHPPFAGTVADGYVWGRGALDDKVNVIAQLEAAEALLAAGYTPRRTILFSFGHDEELGGVEGTTSIVATLKQRGVHPLLVADEGGAVVEGAMPGLEAPLAAVGIAEKGYVSVELSVETPGGHSSQPPPHTAVGRVARAVTALEDHQLESHFGGPMSQTLDAISPHVDFAYRLVLRNLWLFGPLVERVMLSDPTIAPLLRTTTAPTIFQAGVKDNVLPDKARAVVNFRIFPGDSIESVMEHVRQVVDDDQIAFAVSGKQREPSGVTATDGEAFELLTTTIRQVFPDAVPAPYLIGGGTDSRQFREISDGVFGFMPVRVSIADVKRAHGNDERLRVDSFLEGIGFYAQLIRNAGGER